MFGQEGLTYGFAFPPQGGDYYYFGSQSSVTICGVLAPGTSVDVSLLAGIGSTDNNPGLNFANLSFIDSTPGAYSKTFVFPQLYLGDLFGSVFLGDAPLSTGNTYTAFQDSLYESPTGIGQVPISGTGTVSVDPSFGAVGAPSYGETQMLASVPEQVYWWRKGRRVIGSGPVPVA